MRQHETPVVPVGICIPDISCTIVHSLFFRQRISETVVCPHLVIYSRQISRIRCVSACRTCFLDREETGIVLVSPDFVPRRRSAVLGLPEILFHYSSEAVQGIRNRMGKCIGGDFLPNGPETDRPAQSDDVRQSVFPVLVRIEIPFTGKQVVTERLFQQRSELVREIIAVRLFVNQIFCRYSILQSFQKCNCMRWIAVVICPLHDGVICIRTNKRYFLITFQWEDVVLVL